ncbi:transcription activator of gluconeogenesis [Parathielavia hyrcaniae]|uniref:Transcription activator of gluconeogenesis n=1 Tax=Parathielavia hyrcaniae TaxID=113614 RepID=A0AAN6Q7R1_9PEZI|nr:transcription activator of gluconeogenesis [Parathielavia hyrcaniae]
MVRELIAALGDERPCQRCIKRGLMDSCQDGVRKKAKYLHDAPPEALRPVLGPTYNPNPSPRQNGHRNPSVSTSEASSTAGTFFSQPTPAQFPLFSAAQPPIGTLAESLPFGSQQSPVSPSFQPSATPQISGMTVPQVSSPMANFGALPFDPSDPNIFNFNLEGLNFGSQYGALEFGMLGHMSSGAAETPPQDTPIPRSASGSLNFGHGHGVFGNGVNQYDKVYEGNNILDGFLGLDANSNALYSQGNLQHGLPHAYAIAAGSNSVQSPSTDNNSPQPTTLGFDGSPTMATFSTTPGSKPPNQQRPTTRQSNALAKLGTQSILGKRQRDPSHIYDTVKEPFGYVASFHKLFNLIQSRFAPAHTSRIAKSLASIRPSLLASTRNLTRQDLVFMEKYFQRSLFEYEEFMHQCSSPTLACRRTGEVASVNKEFTALTGWTKDVLLGKQPNRNANLGGSAPAPPSSKGRVGLTTPRLKTLNMDTLGSSDSPQPVFLAELLDHDSVVEFYEDYSQLAFNDSRGHKTRKCRLLKYRAADKEESVPEGNPPDQAPHKDPRNSILSSRVAKIDGEHGISKLERDGKLECSYTWTIKRDMFDMPMLFIINFLPCYYRNHNQLAV